MFMYSEDESEEEEEQQPGPMPRDEAGQNVNVEGAVPMEAEEMRVETMV